VRTAAQIIQEALVRFGYNVTQDVSETDEQRKDRQHAALSRMRELGDECRSTTD